MFLFDLDYLLCSFNFYLLVILKLWDIVTAKEPLIFEIAEDSFLNLYAKQFFEKFEIFNHLWSVNYRIFGSGVGEDEKQPKNDVSRCNSRAKYSLTNHRKRFSSNWCLSNKIYLSIKIWEGPWSNCQGDLAQTLLCNGLKLSFVALWF